MNAAAVSACAAALAAGLPTVALGAPTCADVLQQFEKQMAAGRLPKASLRIVPKGLATGRVLASCEGGSQRIVARPEAPAPAGSAPSLGKAAPSGPAPMRR